MKNKMLLFILALSLLVIPTTIKAEEPPIKLWINGNLVSSDAAPFIENNRTLVPIRIISENLGYKVSWVPEEQKVAIFLPENEGTGSGLFLIIGSKEVGVSESETVTIDTAPKIVNNRTFVPIRFIAEEFGLKVNWDADNKTVVIGDGYVAPINSPVPSTTPMSTNNNGTTENLNAHGGWRDPKKPAYVYAEGKIIGNKKSMIYHSLGQQGYKKVAYKNAVYFNTSSEAVSAGYRAAEK